MPNIVQKIEAAYQAFKTTPENRLGAARRALRSPEPSTVAMTPGEALLYSDPQNTLLAERERVLSNSRELAEPYFTNIFRDKSGNLVGGGYGEIEILDGQTATELIYNTAFGMHYLLREKSGGTLPKMDYNNWLKGGR